MRFSRKNLVLCVLSLPEGVLPRRRCSNGKKILQGGHKWGALHQNNYLFARGGLTK